MGVSLDEEPAGWLCHGAMALIHRHSVGRSTQQSVEYEEALARREVTFMRRIDGHSETERMISLGKGSDNNFSWYSTFTGMVDLGSVNSPSQPEDARMRDHTT